MQRWMMLLLALVMATTLGSARALAEPAVEHGAAPAADTAHAAAAEHGSGVGELIPVSPEGQNQALVQAVWVVIIFLILLAILYPTAWKGVLHGLAAREQRIRKDIADAEALRVKAEQTLAEYNKQLATAENRVREMMAAALADGERLASTIRDNATKEAEATRARSIAEIEAASKLAITQIHAETAELATRIAEKIIRRNLNVDDQRALVRESLDQLQTAQGN